MTTATSLQWCLVILIAFAFTAGAQTPGYGVSLSAESTEADTVEGCATFNATVENTGTVPGSHDISLAADAGDSGWTIDPSPPSSVSLEAGGSEDFSFGACAPDDSEEGASATIDLVATVESDPAPENKASDSESFTATFVAATDDDGDDTDGGTGDPDNETDPGENGDVGEGPGDDGNETNGSPGPTATAIFAVTAAALLYARRRT